MSTAILFGSCCVSEPVEHRFVRLLRHLQRQTSLSVPSDRQSVSTRYLFFATEVFRIRQIGMSQFCGDIIPKSNWYEAYFVRVKYSLFLKHRKKVLPPLLRHLHSTAFWHRATPSKRIVMHVADKPCFLYSFWLCRAVLTNRVANHTFMIC